MRREIAKHAQCAVRLRQSEVVLGLQARASRTRASLLRVLQAAARLQVHVRVGVEMPCAIVLQKRAAGVCGGPRGDNARVERKVGAAPRLRPVHEHSKHACQYARLLRHERAHTHCWYLQLLRHCMCILCLYLLSSLGKAYTHKVNIQRNVRITLLVSLCTQRSQNTLVIKVTLVGYSKQSFVDFAYFVS